VSFSVAVLDGRNSPIRRLCACLLPRRPHPHAKGTILAEYDSQSFRQQQPQIFDVNLPTVVTAIQQAMEAIPSTDLNRPAVRAHHSTANPYEKSFGYYRAVRRGPFIFVSGTTAIDSTTQTLQALGDASAQTAIAIQECISAVEALHGKRTDICRVRMFIAVS
jgi:enamine deaminase RidA (YjgF/YER057c/UK114 family)